MFLVPTETPGVNIVATSVSTVSHSTRASMR